MLQDRLEKSYGTDTGKAFQPVFAGTDDCNFIFCLASAVCVQIFVKAHTISRETQELNTALEKVSGYTELFLADELTEDTEVFYDADWQECSKDEASYEIVIRVEPDGKLLHGTFTVQRLSGEQPEEIYSVETDRMTGTERE